MNVNLFAGAGGMAIGLSRAGFGDWRFFEVDSDACGTLRKNTHRDNSILHGFVHQGRVEEVDWEEMQGRVRLLAGGVPCAPFSWAGNGNGHADHRNMFPEMLRAFREIEPEAVLIENVHGIVRPAFKPYVDYVLRQLRNPRVIPLSGENWESHDSRIGHLEKSAFWKPDYSTFIGVFNAADFGVPQTRRRVIIVALRGMTSLFKFPQPTHSRGNLLHDLRGTDYWERNRLNRPIRVRAPKGSSAVIDGTVAWRTVRESISDLPELASQTTSSKLQHWSIPGARTYRGHTGSSLDWPSKTVKAGVHWIPGGENVIRMKGGKVRYYSVREAARIQTFPDSHIFAGECVGTMIRQIGNAVPCQLALVLGRELRSGM